MVDYHIHSTFSCDSRLKPEFVCQQAIKQGFNEIAFTEHLDLEPGDEGYGLYDYEAISKRILELKNLYNGKLEIKKGLEVTYQKKREYEIKEFLKDKDFDFVIGSVHLIGDFDISQEEGTKEYFNQFDREEAFLSYFDVTYDLVNSGIFDVLGHFEMVRRYGLKYVADYRYEEFKEIIDRILNRIVVKQMALEVNTSGVRHLPAEIYPQMEILRRYLDIGGRYFTIGSDAHLPEHIGYRIPETMKQLQGIGIEEITLFSNREKRFYKMEQVSNINTK